MNLKKMIFINAVVTFLLCFFTHFIYNVFPNSITAIFFPVNESIWEHMKMLYTTILLYGIIEYFIIKKFHIPYHNFLLSLCIKAIVSIPLYLIFFLPIFYNFGEIMIISFMILFITIFIVNILGYKILCLNPIHFQKEIAIFFIILVYLLMAVLTYKPPHSDLFFDSENEKYGINDYLIEKK